MFGDNVDYGAARLCDTTSMTAPAAQMICTETGSTGDFWVTGFDRFNQI